MLEDFFKTSSKDDEKKIVDSFVESDTGSMVSEYYLFFKSKENSGKKNLLTKFVT